MVHQTLLNHLRLSDKMPKMIVTEKAVKELIKQLFENDSLGSVFFPDRPVERPVSVNPVVDPSAVLTDKDHKHHKPQNSVELQVAIKKITNDLPDVEASKIYDTVVKALENDDEESDMKTKKNKVEEAIRLTVRKMIDEAWVKDPKTGVETWTDETPKKSKAPAFGAVVGDMPPVTKVPMGVRGGEAERRFQKSKASLAQALKEPVEDEDSPMVAPEVERRKNVTMTDVQGASFQEIAEEMGFSVSGAKQAVDKALAKVQWLTGLAQSAPEDMDIMTLTAMNDYIQYLNKSGELTSEDMSLLKSHPDIVQSLDGFREFLDKYIRKARKTSGAPVEESRSRVQKRTR